jgi:serine/threonine protein kinase
MKKYSIVGSKFRETENHKLAYSQKGRKMLSENKGLLKAFREMNHKKLTKYKDPKGRFTIEKVNNKIKTSTNEMYIIKINKDNKKYFVKEINENPTPNSRYPTFNNKLKIHLNGFYEMKAIKVLKSLGINIIDAHFSYLNIKSKKAYIVYDFTNLQTVKELTDNHKLTLKESISISRKREIIESIIDKGLDNHKYLKSKNTNITGPTNIRDLVPNNLLYNTKTKEIYILDPWYIS